MPVMAPPAGDGGNVIRRSIYQNANTMVELLIKSKEPRPGAGGRSTVGSEPAWPAAVPVRRDGRPLSVAAGQLPARPRTGRPLPAWQPAGQQERRAASPERPAAARGGRAAPGGGGGQRQAAGRALAARGQPPPPRPSQGAAPGRPGQGRPAAREADREAAEAGASEEFAAWTEQLNRLVQDIRKRPATAHLRPLLSRLEETVRVPPLPPPAGQQHDPLRGRLEEIQQENEELQRKFQTLSAGMREYQQQRLAGSGGGGGGGGVAASDEERLRRAEAETELAEVKHQLAKYKKYAKELKKTKENLLNTIQTMEESHATELKALKEEHETQVSQVLAHFNSEAEILVSFRADAEAVQRSLTQRVRENSELQRALAERDIEVERLAALNQLLHGVALKQLQQLSDSELPLLSQLRTKLQSPSGGGGCSGQDGAGDGAARPDWPVGRDLSLLNLDVTEPLPPAPSEIRLFAGAWADLSLASLVGSAAPGVSEAGPRTPADGGRRPRSGGAGDPPAAGGDGGGPRHGTARGADSRPQRQQESSDGATNRRLFGGDGDQAGGRASDQRPSRGGRSEAVPDTSGRGDQRSDSSGRGNQRPDSSGRGYQRPESSGRGDQIPNTSGRGDQGPDMSGRGDQGPDMSGRGDKKPDSSGSGTQRADSSGRGDKRPESSGSGTQRADISGGSDRLPVDVGPGTSSVPAAVDRCGAADEGGGAADCRRPAPVGSQSSQDAFQCGVARLNERLSDLQRAAQEISP